MELDGKVCLITGGTKGIGAAAAVELARRGAHISINGRAADEEANRVKDEVEALGRKCHLHIADVSLAAEAVRCVETTAETLGSVDVLIHSAGGAVPGSLIDVTTGAWNRAFDIHVHAIFHLCRAAIPWMKGRREGAIVLVSSVAGLRGCAGAIAYGVVKGALPQFARSLARELADDNIRVNCVSPGIIRTRFQDHLTPDQVANNIKNRIPLHREGKPEEVADAIAMLVCNDFITGENVVIDGGMTMRIV
ncbi:MAG TPA: SDR family NAD(P)-dependent oxidoreductase [Candidatus Angelobacter sp.]|jgi:NAD(P)-dependent dehydrogenase (short-subunit alcohol dehydrogenase family)